MQRSFSSVELEVEHPDRQVKSSARLSRESLALILAGTIRHIRLLGGEIGTLVRIANFTARL